MVFGEGDGSDLGPGYFVISGLLAITVTIFLPEGVWGLIKRLIRIDLLPIAHQEARRVHGTHPTITDKKGKLA